VEKQALSYLFLWEQPAGAVEGHPHTFSQLSVPACGFLLFAGVVASASQPKLNGTRAWEVGPAIGRGQKTPPGVLLQEPTFGGADLELLTTKALGHHLDGYAGTACNPGFQVSADERRPGQESQRRQERRPLFGAAGGLKRSDKFGVRRCLTDGHAEGRLVREGTTDLAQPRAEGFRFFAKAGNHTVASHKGPGGIHDKHEPELIA